MSTLSSKHNKNAQINTLLADPVAIQIVEVVTREELSSREISDLLHENKKEVKKDIALLTRAHILKRHTHRNHQPTYVFDRPQLEQTVHILYGLWADTISSRGGNSTLTI